MSEDSELVRKVVQDLQFEIDIDVSDYGLGVRLNKDSLEDAAYLAIKTTLEELRKWEVDNHLPGHACARRFAREAGVSLGPESDGGQQDG